MTLTTPPRTSRRRTERDESLVRSVRTQLRRRQARARRVMTDAEVAVAARDESIRQALEAGLTYDEIAEATGLNRSRVGQIARSVR